MVRLWPWSILTSRPGSAVTDLPSMLSWGAPASISMRAANCVAGTSTLSPGATRISSTAIASGPAPMASYTARSSKPGVTSVYCCLGAGDAGLAAGVSAGAAKGAGGPPLGITAAAGGAAPAAHAMPAETMISAPMSAQTDKCNATDALSIRCCNSASAFGSAKVKRDRAQYTTLNNNCQWLRCKPRTRRQRLTVRRRSCAPTAASLALARAEKLQHHLAAVRPRAVLGDINALPGAEPKLAARDRHVQRHAVAHGLDVSRHVVGPFDVVHPAGVGRRDALERGDEIGLHVRVGVLLDHQRGRGVLQIKQHNAIASLYLFQKARELARDLEKAFAGRLYSKLGPRDPLHVRSMNGRQFAQGRAISSCSGSALAPG